MGTKITKQNVYNIISIVYGLLVVAVLAFALLAINSIISDGVIAKFYLFLMFVFLAITKGLLSFFFAAVYKNNRIAMIKNIVFGVVFLTLAILILILYGLNIFFYRLLSSVYLSAIVANRICMIFEKKTVGATIYNIILAFLAFMLGLVILATGGAEFALPSMVLLLFIIIVVCFVEVLAFAFSKIQLKGLLKIIRKTYVLEILYGLALLIISFSFYFMVMEDSISTFGDGLWYSFSVVTTIGFGDYIVKSTISRILTVILGIYGIIVVASITSVIVNFYNEVKTKDKDDDKQEINEENQEDQDDQQSEK